MIMRLLPGADWGEILYNLIFTYLFFTFVLTLVSVLRMYRIKIKCNGTKLGKERLKQLAMQGRLKQVPVYTMEEIQANKDLGEVRLSVFPNDSKEKSKYVLVLPGGGYAHCVTREEGYPIAAKLNEKGYTAFVLEYRTRFHCSAYAPMEDVARAIAYIEDHQEEFNIEVDDYALCGFSAGGNLAGMFASEEYGYQKYGVRKPGMLMLGYPWMNISHWLDHPYWNIWKGMIGVWLSERGMIYMFGIHRTKERKESLCVQNHVKEDFPKTYMFSGSRDVLVPASHHAEVFEEALREKNVNHRYRRFFGLPHGIGLGLGTKAEVWMDEALAFWADK